MWDRMEASHTLDNRPAILRKTGTTHPPGQHFIPVQIEPTSVNEYRRNVIVYAIETSFLYVRSLQAVGLSCVGQFHVSLGTLRIYKVSFEDQIMANTLRKCKCKRTFLALSLFYLSKRRGERSIMYRDCYNSTVR